jgi:hypothetical protein
MTLDQQKSDNPASIRYHGGASKITNPDLNSELKQSRKRFHPRKKIPSGKRITRSAGHSCPAVSFGSLR